jgi:D-cysteine desulfhydrase family pyridoxal phosphate-dependent enzyme
MIPKIRLKLALLPTPLYPLSQSSTSRWLSQIHTNNDEDDTTNDITINSHINQVVPFTFWIKRDDMTGGLELGGNKIRKLEFLLADALQNKQCSAVVTIGGIQSNHARATAAAARMVGLQPHLILRTKEPEQLQSSSSSSMVGNLLVNRLVGSHIYTCTPGEYGRIGSDELVRRVGKYIEESSKGTIVPYLIPVGGSNALGSWGYLQAVDELLQQWHDDQPPNEETALSLDHVVLACGSGGTVAGVCLGLALAYERLRLPPPHIHAVGVCDDPEYFYRHVTKIAHDMGFVLPPSSTATSVEEYIRQHLTVYQGKGLGYAVSTAEELAFVAEFARDTGVVLDPVYTGKALFHFVHHVLVQHPESFHSNNNSGHQKKNILFWHTGGGLGLYDKANDLLAAVESSSPIQRLDVYGTGEGVNV